MTDAEIRRAFERMDRALTNTVSQDAWLRENQHLRDQIAEGDKDCRERTDEARRAAKDAFDRLENRGQITIGRILTILAILATLLAGWWAVYGNSKGIH
jgi:hypothetical protein